MLSNSCEYLTGVGPTIAAKLAKCGIFTIQDLLFHLPYKYQDRTRITPIQDLRSNEWCVIAGHVCKTEIKYGKRMMLNCYVEDKTGVVKLRFFHFNKQQIQALNNSTMIRAFGEVRGFNNQLEMIHPEYQLIDQESDFQVEETLTPIYPSTQGLTQTRLRQLVKIALEQSEHELHQLEWMSEKQLQENNFYDLGEAIKLLHNPPPDISLSNLEAGEHPALKRLIFDELLAQQLSMQFARQSRSKLQAPAIFFDNAIHKRFIESLPFSLTNAQQRVFKEISVDLTQSKPMLRLLQGDVGAGKTIIAALAALQAISQGFQVAFMAPTDLLSEQHTNSLSKWLEPIGINVLRLSGKMKTTERKNALAALQDNSCQLIVGTHALFQEQVEFARLGLVIIDEQHRFGVEQRLLLQQKGQLNQLIPHQLLMTATPIPRTLSMSHFAHLDISVIDELPPGRMPITTAVLNQDKRELIIERLQAAIANGKQAYWVCTLIEESEKLQCIAATDTSKKLQEQLSFARVGLVHGRMKALEKEATMAAFKQGEIDLLVATTVIEVGVDVPNASLMIIENAERLGLSQLHQLRGRVGRGNNQSHCLLLYQPPLSQQGAERLKIMRSTTDGFLISEKDLELRGSGEILGTRQTGFRQFKIANLQRDKTLFAILRPIAKQLVLEKTAIARQITQRWLGNFEQFLQS
ncbi:TPA: ATP-dependent DNA helicase RecG [Legionella pneumophila]|uniref:ATP-dependent DNA helicase RecG n=1 Tax=Legionella pneumophila subsp. pneumophila TaxID=91891 RepID=A0AAV2UXA9_LEGPN|nr:ATP-dependent DNA helicase RecG [Legionella pneumophila]MCK1849284.1 ATP-dependent DNA helicase RecG [Legionella pneumophila]MDI9851183.1 ATP-dependent DNA helicase RecG [Legionella pneumophila]MDW8853431.1 ATP-dependent DNA helicase RecG [Legionella pneumophila]MDW8866401.1 ATP-dependent DNA helicase RecG [Legionella pneumophila]MDW8921923.1 ATP-dependent DNA helicase RecG [Legionella pneumophila]